MNAPIAQLDRAFDYGSKGYGFDSYWARQIIMEIGTLTVNWFLIDREVAQLGSAHGLGP